MDGHLLEQARHGDQAAFEALVAEHAPLGWRLAYALTGATTQATAALTEGASRAFGQGNAMFPSSAAPVELCQRVRAAAGDLVDDMGGPLPFAVAEGGDPAVALAFADLPERCRTALWLHHVERLDDAATAVVLDVPEEYGGPLVDRAHDGLFERCIERHVRTHGGRNCDRALARLGAHAAGRLPDPDVELIERHLRLCDPCRDRADRLATITDRLAGIVPPMPAVTDDVRAAWALIAAPASTGWISSFGEKVIAGVSAGAAAVAVIGAAMAAGSDGSNRGEVVPTEAVVADLSDDDASGDGGPRPPAGRTPFEPEPAEPTPDPSVALARDGADRVPSSPPRAPTPASSPTPASTPEPTPPTPTPAPTPSTTPVGDTTTDQPEAPASNEPLVSIGTNVGDVPVAADVGTEPGVTVGPISVGSQPQPGDDLVEIRGPLGGLLDEPLDGLGL